MDYPTRLNFSGRVRRYHEAEGGVAAESSEGAGEAEEREAEFEVTVREEAEQIGPVKRVRHTRKIMERQPIRHQRQHHCQPREDLTPAVSVRIGV